MTQGEGAPTAPADHRASQESVGAEPAAEAHVADATADRGEVAEGSAAPADAEEGQSDLAHGLASPTAAAAAVAPAESEAPGGENGAQPLSSAPPAPRYRAVGAPFQVGVDAGLPGRTVYRSASATETRPAVKNWATRWVLPPLRVALSLPLVAFAAVVAGVALYAVGLLGDAAPYEAGGTWLALAAAAAAAVCAVALLGWAVLLRERPRHRLWLLSLLTATVLAVPAALAAGLAMWPLLAAVAAGALAFVALASALCGAAAHLHLETGPAPKPSTRRGWFGWAWRIPVVLFAAGGAAAAALLAFSLFAVCFVPAQEPFALGPSVWQQVTVRGGAGLLGGVLAVAAANAAAAALFGLMVHGAIRTLGWWRGRLHLWWLITAAATLPLGFIAWLLDSSLPRW